MLSQPLPLAQLLDAGVRLSWSEALAVVQSLAAAASACPGVEPGGDAIEHFAIDCNGAVVAVAACRFVALGELALFLGHLLPSPSADAKSRAPAGLHYAIARALGLVEGPPFVSVQQFSKSLERFERGERRELLRSVYAKHAGTAEGASSTIAATTADRFLGFLESAARRSYLSADIDASPPVERRAKRPSPDTLRRMLREADRRNFEQAAAALGARDEDARRHNGPTVDRLRRMLREADLKNFEASRSVRAAGRPWSPSPRAYAALALAALGAAAVGAGIADRDQLAAYATRLAQRAHAAAMGSSPKPGPDSVGTSRGADRASRAMAADHLTQPGRHAVITGRTGDGRAGDRVIDHVRTSRTDGVATTPASADDGRRRGATDDKPAPSPPATAGRSASAIHPTPAVTQHDRDFPDNGRLVRALDVAQRPIFSPSFASDGSAIFFDEKVGSGSSLMQAKTTADGQMHVVSVVDDGAQNYHPHLSPDGRTIAFDSDREGVRAVYLASRDGHHVRRVSGDGYAAVPTWSPDGMRLAFIKAEPGRPNVWNLWSLDLRTGVLSRLTSYRYGQPWGASWFPDGRICYAHEDTLVVLDPRTGESRLYHSPRPHTLVRTPAVSPDGRRVMFQLYRDGAWLLDLRDGSMRKVLSDPSAEEFAWAPDGKEVAFHSRRGGQWGLWFMMPTDE